MKGCYFVTGTDTDIGKTYATCYLLNKYREQGLTTLGLKPVAASGDDGALLQRFSTLSLPLDSINPFYLEEACSPHIAAQTQGLELTVRSLRNAIAYPLSLKADLCLIEGAGGWYVPLSDRICWTDVVRSLDIPVIFVVGMKLGCINHAILTEKALLNEGMKIKGWIANNLSDEMFKYDENLATLKSKLVSPLLEVIPYKALLSSD
jgi:dethiobiotin synthetase